MDTLALLTVLAVMAVIIVILVARPIDPPEEDEHATQHGPGLPHHRKGKP